MDPDENITKGEGNLLVLLIMIPIYTLGFTIVGYLGWRKRRKREDVIEAFVSETILDKSLSQDDVATEKDSKTESETESGNIKVPLPLPLFANSSDLYFRTDTHLGEAIKSCCNASIYDFLWTSYEILVIYSIPLLNVMDYISDISLAVFFLSQRHSKNLGFWSFGIILFQRVTSAIILGDSYGWVIGVRHFFELEVFIAVYNSVKQRRMVLELIQMKIIEGFAESFPQLMIQTYVLLKPSRKAEKTWMLYISIILSMLSLSKCWLFSDMVAIPTYGFSCCNRKETSEKSLQQVETKAKDVESPLWANVSWYIRVIFMWAWRLGEITVTISILAGFADIVSARGTVGLFFFSLLIVFLMQTMYPQSRKCTWFNQSIQKNRSQLSFKGKLENIPVPEISDCSGKPQRESLKDVIRLYCIFPQHLVILLVLQFAELNYFFWALPTFQPKKFVMVYYIWKVSLLIVLLITTVVYEGNKNLYSVFDTLLYFLIVGIFCFTIGGFATWLLSLDMEQWTKATGADPIFLLKLVKQRQYIFIERVITNGCFSAHRLVEDAIAWMSNNDINPNDEDAIAMFVEDQPFCKLLYYLIKHELVEIGPLKKNNFTINAEEPKYYTNYAIPALVYKCNYLRKRTLRSQLAASILLKLVTTRQFIGGLKRLIPYETIMDAGASLHFLRYHLNAPDKFFKKSGKFKCTAKQLFESRFDALFCLRAEFSAVELTFAGFDVETLNNEVVLEKGENGKYFSELVHLRRLKEAGFKRFFHLNFSLEDLEATNLFSAMELLEYHQEFMYQPSVRFTSRTSNNLMRSNKVLYLGAAEV